MSAYLDDVLLLGLNEGLEGLDAGGGGGVGVHQQQVLIKVEDSTKLLKYLKICCFLSLTIIGASNYVTLYCGQVYRCKIL
jgi:hypothetical protein